MRLVEGRSGAGLLGLAALAPAWHEVASGAGLPDPWPTPAGLLLLTTVVAASYTDLGRRKIPNRLTYAAAATGGALALLGAALPAAAGALGAVGPLDFFAGFALGLIPLGLLNALGAVGGGDVKLAAAVGGVLGFWPALDALVVGLTLAALAGAPELALRVARLGRDGDDGPTRLRLPLAPFLAAGTLYAAAGASAGGL